MRILYLFSILALLVLAFVPEAEGCGGGGDGGGGIFARRAARRANRGGMMMASYSSGGYGMASSTIIHQERHTAPMMMQPSPMMMQPRQAPNMVPRKSNCGPNGCQEESSGQQLLPGEFIAASKAAGECNCLPGQECQCGPQCQCHYQSKAEAINFQLTQGPPVTGP